MSPDALAVTGIIITVIIGVSGIFFAKKISRNRQTQRVNQGSTAYQAGRDIITDKSRE